MADLSANLSVRWDLSPRVITSDLTITDVSIQDIVDSCRVLETTVLTTDNISLISAAGKEDLGGGVTVGITATFQNTQWRFAARTIPLDSGNCGTTDTSGTTLYEAGSTFVSDGLINLGDTIFNNTTGEMETIIFITEETLTSFALSGFGGSGWTSGDSWIVYKNVQCAITGGNLVAINALGASIDPVLQSPNVQVVMTSSSSATLQELSSIQFSSFNGGVTVDTTSIYSGEEFPNGTPQQPVNNFVDALVIASTRGFTTLFIIGNATIDSGSDFSTLTLVGESPTKSQLTVSSAADVYNCEFYDAHILGTLDGSCVLKNCLITDLTYVEGYVEQCILGDGTIILQGNAHFLDCWSGVAGSGIPIIDMNGTGANLGVRNYNGGIKLINKTGTEKVSMDINSGHVVLDSTITNGEIVLRGVGKLTDNSTGTTLDTSGLMLFSDIQHASFENRVTIDVVNGIAGTQYPLGTATSPVDNLTDAKTIASSRGFTTLKIKGDLTIGATDNVDEYTFIGDGATLNYAASTITMVSGCSTNNSRFSEARIEGVQGGEVTFGKCVIGDISKTHCEFENCKLVGPVTVDNSAWTVNHITDLHDCRSSLDTFILDYNNSPIQQVYSDFTGHMKVINFTHADATLHMGGSGCKVIIDSSCTNGFIDIHGLADVEDNSTGNCNVHHHWISGVLLQDLHDEAFGKWALNTDGTIMTLYRADGVTVLKTFNIAEAAGTLVVPQSRIPV